MPAAPVPVPRRFEGRSVVVTGAGTGFGAEIAVRAAQEGARAVGVATGQGESHFAMSIEEILETPDVKERVELYHAHAEQAEEQIRRCAQVHGNLVVLDLRDEEVIHPTNRFMLYALYPQCNISIHVLWGLRQQNTVFAVGRSIIDRSSSFDIGRLMLAHGGGGHEAAGTCQIENERAEAVLAEIVGTIDAGERQTSGV